MTSLTGPAKNSLTVASTGIERRRYIIYFHFRPPSALDCRTRMIGKQSPLLAVGRSATPDQLFVVSDAANLIADARLNGLLHSGLT